MEGPAIDMSIPGEEDERLFVRAAAAPRPDRPPQRFQGLPEIWVVDNKQMAKQVFFFRRMQGAKRRRFPAADLERPLEKLQAGDGAITEVGVDALEQDRFQVLQFGGQAAAVGLQVKGSIAAFARRVDDMFRGAAGSQIRAGDNRPIIDDGAAGKTPPLEYGIGDLGHHGCQRARAVSPSRHWVVLPVCARRTRR